MRIDRRLGTCAALLAVAAALGLGCGSPPGAAAPSVATGEAPASPLAVELDEFMRLAERGEGIAGASVAVVWRGQPLLVRGYGLADVLGREAMRSEHVFRIGSLTKTFTAAAILKLEGQGRLRLDDPITKYVPEYTAASGVTLWHLLTHTGGVPSYTDLPWYEQHQTEATPAATLLAQFTRLPLAFDPGSRFAYSNSGFYLLGLVIEKASGQSYREYLEAELFRPAGLSSTRYCPDEQSYPGAAKGYRRESHRLAPSASLSMTLPFAAGALCSTAPDLVRWFESLAHGKVIGTDAFARMSAPTTLEDGTRSAYGCGLGLSALEGHPGVGHGGGIEGFRTIATYYPADDLYVVVLVNTESDAPHRMADRLARLVLGIGEP